MTGGGGGGGLGGRWGRHIRGRLNAVWGAYAAGRNVIIPTQMFSAPPPPKKRKERTTERGEWCLSLDLSHLCTHSTHIITHPLSACHPTGSRSSWRSLSLCVMLSLSCSVISFFSSRLSRKECVSCRSTSQCQGGKTAHFSVWLTCGVSEVPGGFQEFQLSHPQLWRHLRECHRDHTRHFLYTLGIHLPAVSCPDDRFQGGCEKQSNCTTELALEYGAKHWRCARAWLRMEGRVKEEWWWQRGWRSSRGRESSRGKERQSQSEKSGGVMTRSAQDRGGDRGGSVSDRLLVAPLWRLWSSDPSRNLPYYKASPLHTGTTTKWSNYI